MIHSYIYSTLRNIVNNKRYHIINMIGLLTAFIYISLSIASIYESINYDKFYHNYEYIYRVESILAFPGQEPVRTVISPGALLSVLIEQDGVLAASRLLQGDVISVKIGNDRFHERPVYVDPTFFDVMELPVISGDPRGALSRPDGIVLTQSVAKTLFGDDSVVGRTMRLGDGSDVVIGAVIANIPEQSHMILHMLMPMNSPFNTRYPMIDNQLTTFSTHLYLRLLGKRSAELLQQRLPAIVAAEITPKLPATLREIVGGEPLSLSIQRVDRIHLHSKGTGDFKPHGDTKVILITGSIGTLTFLLALLNFSGLNTFLFFHRANEIAIRKIYGARQHHLIALFMGEAISITLFAAMGAIAIIHVGTEFAGGRLDWLLFGDKILHPFTLGGSLLASVFMGVLGSWYPMMKILGQPEGPPNRLKSSPSAYTNAGLRNGLLFLQYASATALLILSGVIFSQIRHVSRFDVGYDPGGLVAVGPVSGAELPQEAVSAFLGARRSLPGLSTLEPSSTLPGFDGNSRSIGVQVPGTDASVIIALDSVGSGLFSAMGIEPLSGRLFRNDSARRGFDPAKDRNRIIPVVLNKSALRQLGGQSVHALTNKQFDFLLTEGRRYTAEIIGVIDDIKLGTLLAAPAPVVYAAGTDSAIGFVANTTEDVTVDQLLELWTKIIPDIPVKTVRFEEQFENELAPARGSGQLVAMLAMLAIVIAFMGLFGQSALAVQQRAREVAMRRIVGATDFSIVKLFLFRLFIPVAGGTFFAIPFAIYASFYWLSGFVDRISLSINLFLFGILCSLVIGILAIFTNLRAMILLRPVSILGK